MSKRQRIGLVGSVTAQPSSPSPAIDLYRSADFLAARRQVESSCESWFILSPRHYLAGPNDWLEPYAETMADMDAAEREKWSAKVLAELERRVGPLEGKTFELHAPPEFYEHGLEQGLRAAGAKLLIGGRNGDGPDAAGVSAGDVAESEAEAAAAPTSTPARAPKRRKVKAAEPEAPTPAAAAAPARARSVKKMPVSERRTLLDEFYGLLEEQADAIGGRWSLPDCSGDDHWPQQGVVFFFEPGELREDGETPRVVRVATHAVTPGSKIRLWDRLRSDRGAIGGANPGSGNHRASALRRHIGKALIARDGYPEAAETWGSTGRVSAETKQREMALEIAVSRHIGAMDFIWMEVPELEDRVAIEMGIVALLSNLDREAVDPPSPDWLGRHVGPPIADSGLWNVDYTGRHPEPDVLAVLRRLIEI